MSKKNKKKLKKMLRAKALEQARSTSDQVVTTTVPQQMEQPTKETADENPQTAEGVRVKSEIRRILITVGIIVIVIIAIYFVNQKTDLILQAGKYLTNLFNVNL